MSESDNLEDEANLILNKINGIIERERECGQGYGIEDGDITLWDDRADKTQYPKHHAYLQPHKDGIRLGLMREHGNNAEGVPCWDEYVLPLARVMEVLEANIDYLAESTLVWPGDASAPKPDIHKVGCKCGCLVQEMDGLEQRFDQ